jgi:hypothetical protein
MISVTESLILIVLLAALVMMVGAALRAWRRYRGVRVVSCPETHERVAVEVDAPMAAAAAALGMHELHLRSCTRWPERAGCGQECLGQVEAAPAECLARTLVARWYEDKRCAYCGKELGEVHALEHHPALLRPDGTTCEWSEIRPETMGEVFVTHRPICWNCHTVETFRRRFPHLVVDAGPAVSKALH